ncbi:hypothetical protein IFM89_016986 [Coptis chinensis]|uniref:Peptidase A1 domain-containing protein n=1 Tax=Coptis chinensis TaxID=261450 RepID=A0A835LW44_9MAGN|nr:hypothetical protein IFM89_016986 [Coptis chinensis]
MYPGNLTEEKMYELLLDLSNKRVSRLSSELNYAIKNRRTSNGTHPDLISPRVAEAFDSNYLVELAIASPEPQPFFLELDTGSDVIWVQCSGCTQCFHIRDYANFEYSRSSTYEYIGCHDVLCIPRICSGHDICLYDQGYIDGDWTRGVMSKDDFLFYSEDHAAGETVKGVYFGCGLDNNMHWGNEDDRTNNIAGVFGMGNGPQSFISQLGDQGEGRFSYCLDYWAKQEKGISFIRFGEYAKYFPDGSDVKTTPLKQGPRQTFYYVNLTDISVEGVRLELPPETFSVRPDGKGGMILDTGTGPTFVFRSAYNRLEARLKQVFESYELEPWQGHLPGLSLCYVKPEGFEDTSLPSITFHFEGADFNPWPGAAFLILGDFFCLQIRPTGNLTLEQRLERLHNQTTDYVNHVLTSVIESSSSKQSKNIAPTWISPPVALRHPYYYMAIAGFGTFDRPQIPYLNNYLMIDTASDLIWTQCEKCKAVTEGYLGTERFTFSSDTGATESVNLVFGRGFDQKQFNFGQNNTMVGILG